MSPRDHPATDRTAGSRIDRLALRIAARSRTPVPAPPSAVSHDSHLSRRKVLTRALTAGALAIIPLRFANPTAAQAEGYCAAQCLDDANTSTVARFPVCSKAAFGVDLPTIEDYTSYVASKIKFGGLGALLVITETVRFDGCTAASAIRYYHDTGKCGQPNCGNAKKYPRPRECQPACLAGEFCCFCPTGTVSLGCLPDGNTATCTKSCTACLQSKAGGFNVQGRC